MSDGLYEGYREEVKSRERQKRLLEAGGKCFTCDGIAKEQRCGYYADESFFLNELCADESGKPVPFVKEIIFCTNACQTRYFETLTMLKKIEKMAGDEELSPRFRANLLRNIKAVGRRNNEPAL